MADQSSIPDPTPEQQRILERLVGLPFVVLSLHPGFDYKVLGELLDGTKVRGAYVHEVWNAALCWDAIEGAGGFRKSANSVQLQVLAIAEREFGFRLEDGLQTWLTMRKAEYWEWTNRPRALWPKAN